jgi:hypothetical protein
VLARKLLGYLVTQEEIKPLPFSPEQGLFFWGSIVRCFSGGSSQGSIIRTVVRGAATRGGPAK